MRSMERGVPVEALAAADAARARELKLAVHHA